MPKYFPITRKKVVEVIIEVPVGDGDRDVSYLDSFDVSDQLSGTLGPIFADESTEIDDIFVAYELAFGDTSRIDDEFVVQAISLEESADISDSLAGTLGPVTAPDTFDTTDTFVAYDLVFGDSKNLSEEFTQFYLDFEESGEISDRLSGTLGPIFADESTELDDIFVARELTFYESADVTDDADASLEVYASDSFDFEAVLGHIMRFEFEMFDMSDDPTEITLETYDTQDVEDQFGDLSIEPFQDMSEILDETYPTITATQPISKDISDAFEQVYATVPDSKDISDTFGDLQIYTNDSNSVGDAFNPITVENLFETKTVSDLFKQVYAETPDSKAIADARRNATITNATMWANAVVSQSGMTNPNNAIDTNTTTGASISITQSGGLVGGSSQNASGNITISLPNPSIVPSPTISTPQLQWGWTTTASGGLQSGNSVNAVIEYSLNDGGSWTNLQTVTTVNTTGDPTLNITASYAQLLQLRFRVTVTVVSGTTAVVGGANQTFSFRYGRVLFGATQTL